MEISQFYDIVLALGEDAYFIFPSKNEELPPEPKPPIDTGEPTEPTEPTEPHPEPYNEYNGETSGGVEEEIPPVEPEQPGEPEPPPKEPAEPTYIQTKISITNATQAAYSMVDREFLFKGNFIVPDGVNLNQLPGKYFARALLPDVLYLMISSIAEPTNKQLGFLYAVQCNDHISICKTEEQKDKWGNTKNVYIPDPEKENIPCYFYSALRSFKVQNDRKLDQAMYTLIVPAAYKLSPMQKILKKSFAEGEYIDEYYLVNSVETALVRMDAAGEIIGVVSAQLSKDIDGGSNL